MSDQGSRDVPPTPKLRGAWLKSDLARLHHQLHRRTAERAQVQREDDVPLRQFTRDPPCGVQLDAMPLIVIDRQCDHRKAALARNSGANHRIESAGKKNHCLFHGRPLRTHEGLKEGPPVRRRAAQVSGIPARLGGKRAKIRHDSFLARDG